MEVRKERVSVTLDSDVLKKLKEEAKKRRLKISPYLNQLIGELIESNTNNLDIKYV